MSNSNQNPPTDMAAELEKIEAMPKTPTLTEVLMGAMEPKPGVGAAIGAELEKQRLERDAAKPVDPWAKATPPRTAAQSPSVGRIVHYYENCQGELEERAAIVVRVHNVTCVNLTVFDGEGYGRAEISVCQGMGPGEWNWPPRV